MDGFQHQPSRNPPGKIAPASPDLNRSDHTPSFRTKQADAFSFRLAPARRSACGERTSAPSLTVLVSDEISLLLSSTTTGRSPFSVSRAFPAIARDTIRPWELSSKILTFSAELPSFAERAFPSKRFSITSKAEKQSKTFWKDFPPSRANPQSLLSKKQNTFSSPVLKCAF